MKPIMYEGLPTNGDPSLTRDITIVNEWLNVIKTVIFVAVGICACIVLLHASSTLTKLDTTLDSASKEIAALDNTRKSADDLMVQATVLITDADTAATDETAFIKTANTKLSATLDGVNGLITQATTDEHELSLHTVQTLDATTATISGVQPVLAHVQIVTDSANDDLRIVNQRLADPAISQTLANVNSMTASGASILKDGADEVHTLIHPAKKVGFWAGLNATVMYIKRFIPPLF